ncbi:MAG: Rrf2 family transcriptional regulator [Sumerlaeia bacterium]
MKLSRKADYALRVLFTLARERDADGPVPVRQLALKNAIPRKFLEAIMRDLRELDLVESTAGKNGGYCLKRSPAEITIGEILRAFDGHIGDHSDEDSALPPELAAAEGPACVQRILREIGETVDRMMDDATLESVLRGFSLAQPPEMESYVHGHGI